jgi:archaellum component FlaC
LLKLLDELADEVRELREEMATFRKGLTDLTDKVSGASAGAGLLGLLGKAIRR